MLQSENATEPGFDHHRAGVRVRDQRGHRLGVVRDVLRAWPRPMESVSPPPTPTLYISVVILRTKQPRGGVKMTAPPAAVRADDPLAAARGAPAAPWPHAERAGARRQPFTVGGSRSQ